MSPDDVVDRIHGIRAASNKLWCQVYILAGSVAPEKARKLLHEVDRGNAKVERAERHLLERDLGMIPYLERARSRQNDLLCGLIRLVMHEAPQAARRIFEQIEANDAKILALTKHLRR